MADRMGSDLMPVAVELVYVIDAPPHAGLSELIVPMGSPGITVSPIKDMSGARHFCEVRFERVSRFIEYLGQEEEEEGRAYGLGDRDSVFPVADRGQSA